MSAAAVVVLVGLAVLLVILGLVPPSPHLGSISKREVSRGGER